MSQQAVNEKLKKLVNYFQSGNFEHVIRETRTLLKKFPQSPGIYNLLGLSLQQINNFEDAKKSYLKALQLEPKNPAVLNNLGSVCRVMEDFEDSEKYLTSVLKMQPNYINALSNYGNLKRELNDFKGAIELYKKALSINDKQFLIHHNLSLSYLGIGEFDLAKKHCLLCLENNPGHHLSHKMLSSLTKYTSEDQHFKLMKEELNKKNLNNTQKISLNFALSKAYEDLKNYEKSYLHMKTGNEVKRKNIKFNIDNEIELFNNIQNIFLKYNFEDKKDKIKEKNRIIFICGMPRSGTTLVEQIISSHNKVYGAGELNYLSKSIRKNLYDKNKINEKKIFGINENSNNYVAEDYFNYLNSLSFNEKIITDKAPLNFRWIGFIKIFLPESKIIHCSRNNRDNCLSLYKNSFDSDKLNWCYDQKELSKYYNLYFDLMNFWREKIPNFIYEAKYEEIISNQENETKKLLKFCDLNWDQNCLNFHKNRKTPIKTASIVQARKPIYSSSVKSNINYEKYFDELFNSLKS